MIPPVRDKNKKIKTIILNNEFSLGRRLAGSIIASTVLRVTPCRVSAGSVLARVGKALCWAVLRVEPCRVGTCSLIVRFDPCSVEKIAIRVGFVPCRVQNVHAVSCSQCPC